ncbi:hypothetical protein [Methylocystis heyeri]|uniref:Peptidase MA-like domain-containing protein n=1 Tax=Methylocystis heyeri TaxID=391905 RepID=A0A6B8KJC0_9HYPH|nr:hypothetical protein [Methylocystis heyeri]QGM47151.1 hypothetical protein H2LOC_016425 [Methylocystis heyeri]
MGVRLRTAMLAAALLVAGFALRAPFDQLRRYLIARCNDPVRLPRLAEESRVRFQPGARDCAARVAEMLPAALARIEQEQGRPFANPPTVAVYVSYEDYARAGGLGDASVAAVARSGYVLLSPTLCGDESERLAGVLAHELSHSHIFGWRRSWFAARPPSWFTEGLAVMVSGGGGAEGVDEAMAVRAMARGWAITIEDTGLWRDFGAIGFAAEPPPEIFGGDRFAGRQRLAYREAQMFVAWLRRIDPQGFARLLNRVENNESFKDSFVKIYGAGSSRRWSEFLAGVSR